MHHSWQRPGTCSVPRPAASGSSLPDPIAQSSHPPHLPCALFPSGLITTPTRLPLPAYKWMPVCQQPASAFPHSCCPYTASTQHHTTPHHTAPFLPLLRGGPTLTPSGARLPPPPLACPVWQCSDTPAHDVTRSCSTHPPSFFLFSNFIGCCGAFARLPSVPAAPASRLVAACPSSLPCRAMHQCLPSPGPLSVIVSS